MTNPRKILITSALPYANGEIHLGHMVEHLITDYWARFQRLRGHECVAFCADDTHGAPIMVEARKKGITAEELIGTMQKKHEDDLQGFDVHYDHYGSTNSKANQSLCDEIYKSLFDKGYIESRSLEQFYCSHDKMFLPDRFVKGECPKCGAQGQYGDSCDSCGAVYSSTELKEARCSLCQKKPEVRTSEHQFVKVGDFTEFLKEWVPKHTSSGVSKKLQEWFEAGLKDWCLTRDKPYFGFQVPGLKDKYYYVWFDAPIGYIAATKEWCDKKGSRWEDYWRNESCEIYHNIGKDIVYFHCLFWPMMLRTSGLKTPDQIFVHGMLTVNGQKLSKSKGTFINARTYLKHFPADYLRYYFACKLSDGITDLDLNLDEFVSRVNGELIGKITNIASRGFQMLQKNFQGHLGRLDEEGKKILNDVLGKAEAIAQHYEKRQFSKALVLIRDIADQANKYFDDHTPWKLIKEDPDKTQVVLTTILNVFRVMTIYLQPVLPSYAGKVAALFGEAPYTWQDLSTILEDQVTNPFQHILKRIEPKKVKQMLEDSKEEQKEFKKQEDKKQTANSNEPQMIQIEDFAKVDLRAALIKEASYVDGAASLLSLTLDVGPLGERHVFAGIKNAYEPDQLKGRLVVLVANLKPRKMKFGLSEGMILCAGPGKKELWLLSPDSGAKPGMKIS